MSPNPVVLPQSVAPDTDSAGPSVDPFWASCRILLRTVGLDHHWTPDGLDAEALGLAASWRPRGEDEDLTPEREKATVVVLCQGLRHAVWNEGGSFSLSALLELPVPTLLALAGLLTAWAHDDLPAWVAFMDSMRDERGTNQSGTSR